MAHPSVFGPQVFLGARAFDLSGVQVNSVEADSAVRCEHSEFESPRWTGAFPDGLW